MELEQVKPVRCIHLQSKAMAIHGEGFENDTDYQDGMTDFSCIMSGRSIGPDYGDVGMKACCNPDRDCYEEY